MLSQSPPCLTFNRNRIQSFCILETGCETAVFATEMSSDVHVTAC